MLQQVMTNPKEITFREIPVPEITAGSGAGEDHENRSVRFGHSCISRKGIRLCLIL